MLIETELGIEAQCVTCDEWLPRDSEFFPTTNRGSFARECKACRAEKRRHG